MSETREWTIEEFVAHGIAADLRGEPGESLKLGRIRDVRSDGLEPRIDVVRHGLTEAEALTSKPP